jgi:hypothetical protein
MSIGAPLRAVVGCVGVAARRACAPAVLATSALVANAAAHSSEYFEMRFIAISD